MKKIIVILICFSILFHLVGCNDEKNNTIKSNENEVEKDIESLKYPGKSKSNDLIINCQNYNYCFYPKSMGYTSIQFDVVSIEEILKKDFKVVIPNLSTKYKVIIEKSDEEEFEYDLLNFYNNTECNNDVYEKVLKCMPTLYKYNVAIIFDTSNYIYDTNEEFENMQVLYKNKTYMVNVGKIKFDYVTEININEEDVEQTEIASSGIKVLQNKNGEYNCNIIKFKTVNDIFIEDVYVCNCNDYSVQEVIFCIEGEKNIDIKWKGKDKVKIPKNSNVLVKIKTSIKSLANEFTYSANPMWVIKYTTNNGIEKNIVKETIISTRPNKFEEYAYFVDKINIMNYYYEKNQE